MYTGTSCEVSLVYVYDQHVTLRSQEAALKQLTKQYGLNNVVQFLIDLKCTLDAPDYTIVRVDNCRFLASPKVAETPMLVFRVTNL